MNEYKLLIITVYCGYNIHTEVLNYNNKESANTAYHILDNNPVIRGTSSSDVYFTVIKLYEE